MRTPPLSPAVPNTTGLNQAGSATPAGSPTEAASSSRNQPRQPSEQPIIHATGRRMSAAFRLTDLPPEMRTLIGAAAPTRDRIALAQADPREMYPLIRNEVRAAFIVTTHAPTVNTLAGFNSLLRMIQGLPRSLQGEPLAALGARILRFPPNEQQKAIDTFVASAQNLPAPRPALLDELIQAAANGPAGLAAREQNAVKGPAGAAVRNGDSVSATAERYGITDAGLINTLEVMSVKGPAGAAVRNGDSVSATAERYGITGAGPINTLEVMSVNGPAGAA